MKSVVVLLVASGSVACSAGRDLPDDDTVRVDVVPKLEWLFADLGLEPDFEESGGRCSKGFGLGGTTTLTVTATAPADDETLDRIAQLWGVPVEERLRMEDGAYEFGARIVGDGILRAYGRAACPT